MVTGRLGRIGDVGVYQAHLDLLVERKVVFWQHGFQICFNRNVNAMTIAMAHVARIKVNAIMFLSADEALL